MRAARVAAATAGLVAAVAQVPAAGAATVSLAYEEPIPGVEPNAAYALTVQAAPGEANRLTVSHDGMAYAVSETAAPLTPGAGCAAAGPRRVRCRAPRDGALHSVFVEAGDRDDRIAVATMAVAARIELRGGTGADLIAAGAGRDLVFGGDGSDALAGRGGPDTLDGGPGDDWIDGGEGRDRLSYERRRAPVRVDLAAATGGGAGERDRLGGIEEAVGGSGTDVLAGDRGSNTLLGGKGDARDGLFGRGGDDVLSGFRVSGGAGDDALDGEAVSCGAGADLIARIAFKPRGPFPGACEEVAAGAFLALVPDPVRRTTRFLTYRVRCVALGPCRGTLELRDRRGRVGRTTFSRTSASATEPWRVRIRLGRRPARRVATLRVRGAVAYRRDSFRSRVR